MLGRAGINPEVVPDLALIVLPLAALVIALRLGRELPWLGLVLVAALTLPFLPIAALANGHPLFAGECSPRSGLGLARWHCGARCICRPFARDGAGRRGCIC